jgi:hypothetical protein
VIGSELWVQELLAILPILGRSPTLDIVPELTDAEAKGLTLESKVGKKRLNEHLSNCLNQSPLLFTVKIC